MSVAHIEDREKSYTDMFGVVIPKVKSRLSKPMWDQRSADHLAGCCR
jgi:hypothetical protein